jgi:hypothetical protein
MSGWVRTSSVNSVCSCSILWLRRKVSRMQPVFSQCLLSLAVAGSLCWFITSSLWIYPHSLSYFNESIGGPLNGPKHLLGSNVDWGQDLRYVNWWQTGPADTAEMYLAPVVTLNPSHLGIRYQVMSFSMPDCQPAFTPSGRYFISCNLLAGLGWFAYDVDGSVYQYHTGAFRSWNSLPSSARAAYSYRLFIRFDERLRRI